jgi:NAD(P) transhydrogenase subunit alpha
MPRKSLPIIAAIFSWLMFGVVVWAHPGHDAPDGDLQASSHQHPSISTSAVASASSAKLSRGQVLVASLTVFSLAVFVGFEVINKVPPTLHTPLMSGSNAISGITVVGAILAAGQRDVGLASILGAIAVALANINVVGGFLVTHRMLKMFKKR